MPSYLFGRKFNDQHGIFAESFQCKNNITLEQACSTMLLEIMPSSYSKLVFDSAEILCFAKAHDGTFYFQDEFYTFVMTPLSSVESIYDFLLSPSQSTPPFKRPSKIDLEVDTSFDESFD
jgi:hypothetical protein